MSKICLQAIVFKLHDVYESHITMAFMDDEFRRKFKCYSQFLANPNTVGANYSGQPAVVLAAHLCQAATNSDFSRRDSAG